MREIIELLRRINLVMKEGVFTIEELETIEMVLETMLTATRKVMVKAGKKD